MLTGPEFCRLRARPSVRRMLIVLGFLIAGLSAHLTPAEDTAPASGEAAGGLVLNLEGVVGPATSDFIMRGIDRAVAEGRQLVIVRMNTPGGLDSAMREIISKILASPVPVVVYVAPPGSRAASAGTYILYASHLAAMAPATNLGSATPVNLAPGGMTPARDDGADKEKEDGENAEPKQPGTATERKIINDAVAYIRGLAKLRGRNTEWAERAVREAANLTAEDALQEGVIEIIATDMSDLLDQLHGRTLEFNQREVTLNTEGLLLEDIQPDWRNKLLSIITNPNVAYILMLLGVYGLFFELSNPGALFPGITGAICLLLALYAFQVLPINYAGVALLLLGIVLMVGELFMPSFGALGIGGIVSFVFGSLILMDTEVPAFQISIPVIATLAGITAAFIFTTITLALRQRKRPVVSGREQLLDSVGSAVETFTDEGQVHIHGELWRARYPGTIRKDQRIRVRKVDGLVLIVEPLEESEQ